MGFDDIDRQAQYVLLALYTSGHAVAAPEFKALLKVPPPTFDVLAKGVQNLPDAVTDAGTPLWEVPLPQTHQKALNE